MQKPSSGQPPRRKRAPVPAVPVEIDRRETFGYVEVLHSDGRKTRYRTFGNFDRSPLTPEERHERQRLRRARKRAKRANGTRVRQLLAQHGVDPAAIRFCWRD
jgi:hypothetical protein